MDASTIRLILIVIGAILIVALYLWERHRERRDGYQDDYEDDDLVEEAGADESDGVRPNRREPIFNLNQYDVEEPPEEEPLSGKSSRSSRSWLRSQTGSGSGFESRANRTREPMPEDSLSPEDDEESKPLKTSRVSQTPAPSATKPLKQREISTPEPLLIQLSVSARRYPFKGPDILAAAASCGLYPGEMDIFHCFDRFEDETRIYFSMANMVKPGHFPFDAMDNFSTPGLVLFAQLKGDPEDITILEEMVATARKLAMSLNGDVLDETRRPLTVKKEEELRQAVLENERHWKRIPRR
ncbi:MAG: cell division protein ZipA [Thermochromatium sp.]